MTSANTSEAFFEAKYRLDSDPWNFADDAYEQSRYAATLSALQGRRFKRGFEPGCSIGVLTEQLARFCSQVDAIEISETAANLATQRCHSLPNVHIHHARLPKGIPNVDFDLIVFSEVGYYFDLDELTLITRTLVSRLMPGGLFLAVHWLGSSPDHILSGDEVHAVLEALPGLTHSAAQRHSRFRLDCWIKAGLLD